MINYTKNEQAYIFMSTLEFMTNKRIKSILEYVNNASDIFELKEMEDLIVKDVLGEYYNTFIEKLNNFNFEEFFDNLHKRGIKCLTIESDLYPAKLLRLEDAPYVLYYVGNLDLLNKTSIAMVGSRNPTAYGRIITEKYAKSLAENGFVVVSGLAEGVDKISHQSALDVNGYTIAVLGGGFDHIFPKINVNLAREIAKKGLILTEYYLSVLPAKYTFPKRNRIIAGLSDAVLITEAKEKSGSLYTHEYAELIGVDTYCVPGNINSELSYATNYLIKNGGAYCTTAPEDILQKFGVKSFGEKNKKSKKKLNLTIEEQKIYDILKDGEKDFEFLQENTGFSTQNLNISLTSMEIKGIIKKLAGNLYMIYEK